MRIKTKTILPSNIRQKTREWVYLVRRGHFRSPDNVAGGHIFRSAIAKKPRLQANFMAFCCIESLPIEVWYCGNRNFRTFGSCDLDLDPMTLIYELDPYFLKM